MKLFLDYDDLNRIIELYVCSELGLEVTSKIDIHMSDDPKETVVSLEVYNEDSKCGQDM